MQIDDFLRIHNIVFDKNILMACQSGINLMSQGTDPHHTVDHVYRILDHLDYLLTSAPRIKSKINYEILLPAICWHDVWISKHQASNFVELIWLQMIEGRKSAKMWHKHARGYLHHKHLKAIQYCIRKHSSFQILPTFGLEAKLLIDLDKLEIWNIYRFIDKKESYVSHKEVYRKYIVRLYYQYSWHVGLYIRELGDRFENLRNSFWSGIK